MVEEHGDFYDLYIAGEGGINAKYCTKLFDGYINVERINLNGHFHTEYATDMTSLFGHCSKLQELDVSKFDTFNVIDMSYMFDGCFCVRKADTAHFDISQETDTYKMFG